jgi:hypothetical protein
MKIRAFFDLDTILLTQHCPPQGALHHTRFYTHIYDVPLGIVGVWGIGEGDFLRFHFSHLISTTG